MFLQQQVLKNFPEEDTAEHSSLIEHSLQPSEKPFLFFLLVGTGTNLRGGIYFISRSGSECGNFMPTPCLVHALEQRIGHCHDSALLYHNTS